MLERKKEAKGVSKAVFKSVMEEGFYKLPYTYPLIHSLHDVGGCKSEEYTEPHCPS